MTLWTGHGVVLKSSSQWQLKGFEKKKTWNYLIFKILLINRLQVVKTQWMGFPFIYNNTA